MKRGRGRSTKLTPERQQKIVEAILGGSYFETACAYAGVSYPTGKEWLARGEGTHPDRPWTPLYADFAAAVRDAEAKIEVGATNVVKRAAIGVVDKNGNVVVKADPDFALKFLARRFPKRWGPKEEHELTGPNGSPLPVPILRIERHAERPALNGHVVDS